MMIARHMNLAIVWIIGLLLTMPVSAQDESEEQAKLAQTGFQFLSVMTDARGAAIGEAMTSLSRGPVSLFFNPAGMARTDNKIDVYAGTNTWLAGISHHALAMSIRPQNGRYGVLGLSATSVDYGEIQGTMVWENDQGYLDTELLRPSAFTMGMGYSKNLSDRFSVGGHIRQAWQNLAVSIIPLEDADGNISPGLVKNQANVWAIDFGTLYLTGFKSLAFGMTMRNYSAETQYVTESFQLPLVLMMGVSMNVLDVVAPNSTIHSWWLSIDATHPRSYYEQVKIGTEYELLDLLKLRCGYIVNPKEGDFFATGIHSLTYGFGLRLSLLSFDYSYAASKHMNAVRHYSVNLSL